jgi:hypothetical protein
MEVVRFNPYPSLRLKALQEPAGSVTKRVAIPAGTRLCSKPANNEQPQFEIPALWTMHNQVRVHLQRYGGVGVAARGGHTLVKV